MVGIENNETVYLSALLFLSLFLLPDPGSCFWVRPRADGNYFIESTKYISTCPLLLASIFPLWVQLKVSFTKE